MPAILTLTRPLHDPTAVAQALRLLAEGEIIAAPTDTVYGLMGRVDRAGAIARLFAVKGRSAQKAIPVLIGDMSQLNEVVELPLPPFAEKLATRFWPGPLTLVLPVLPTLPAVLTGGQPTVGVRLPNHGQLRALIRQSGPLAATSANRSGEPEARTAAEVIKQLANQLLLVLSDDETKGQSHHKPLPSTVVDICGGSQESPRILREGPLGAEIRALFASFME